MTANQQQNNTPSFQERYSKLKKERDLRHEERVRWAAELQAAEAQLTEIKTKIKNELGVEPDKIDDEIVSLETEIESLFSELALVLPQRVEGS